MRIQGEEQRRRKHIFRNLEEPWLYGASIRQFRNLEEPWLYGASIRQDAYYYVYLLFYNNLCFHVCFVKKMEQEESDAGSSSMEWGLSRRRCVNPPSHVNCSRG